MRKAKPKFVKRSLRDHAAEDRDAYWLSKTPEERIHAVGVINLTVPGERYGNEKIKKEWCITQVTGPREGSLTFQFPLNINQDEDGVWIVECPSIPGCVSQGKTRQTALKNIKEAILGCLEVRFQQSKPFRGVLRLSRCLPLKRPLLSPKKERQQAQLLIGKDKSAIR